MTTRVTGQDVRDGTIAAVDLDTNLNLRIPPDPSAVPDNKVLQTLGGVEVWDDLVIVDGGSP